MLIDVLCPWFFGRKRETMKGRGKAAKAKAPLADQEEGQILQPGLFNF